MLYGTLPGVARRISRLVLGTVAFATWPQCRVDEMLTEWHGFGGTALDLAHSYGGGACETKVGQWLRRSGVRNEFVLITKGANAIEDRSRLTPADIVSDLRESLTRLDTDHVDLYVVHKDDPTVPVGVVLHALDDLKRSGACGAYGASNWSTRRLQEAADYARDHGLEGFSCSSPNLSLARQLRAPYQGTLSASNLADRDWYRRTQLPLFAWSSQAGGFFTGRHRPGLGDLDSKMARTYYCDDNWERLRRADELGHRRGLTANQVALAWVLNQPFPTYAIVGPETVTELQSSVQAADVALSQRELAWLDLQCD